MTRIEKSKAYSSLYISDYKNYKDYWNYEDGCVLKGAVDLYNVTGEQKYADFVIAYLYKVIDENGKIANYEDGKYNIDSINSGKALFFAYDYTKDERFYKAIEFIMNRLKAHPRCMCGNFFHKKLYPYQVWLDGLYMAQPFYIEYETRFDNKEKYNDILNQFVNADTFLYDEKKHLYYHAYDEKKEMFWANPENGCSKNFWLRSMGWLVMALIDVISIMDADIYEMYDELCKIFRKVISGLLEYMDEDIHMFYQVIDYKSREGNYLETSGSAMIAYAMMKASRINVLLKEKYYEKGASIFEALVDNKLKETDNGLTLTDMCSVAGLGPDDNRRRDGSVDYYLSEPVVSDDPKGSGAFMMALSEYLRYKED